MWLPKMHGIFFSPHLGFRFISLSNYLKTCQKAAKDRVETQTCIYQHVINTIPIYVCKLCTTTYN